MSIDCNQIILFPCNCFSLFYCFCSRASELRPIVNRRANGVAAAIFEILCGNGFYRLWRAMLLQPVLNSRRDHEAKRKCVYMAMCARWQRQRLQSTDNAERRTTHTFFDTASSFFLYRGEKIFKPKLGGKEAQKVHTREVNQTKCQISLCIMHAPSIWLIG